MDVSYLGEEKTEVGVLGVGHNETQNREGQRLRVAFASRGSVVVCSCGQVFPEQAPEGRTALKAHPAKAW